MITPAYAPTATERVLPRMALDFTTGVLDPRVTVTRALNTATRVSSSGFIEAVNSDLPRFDYDPVTLAPKGLLIEESRQNKYAYSTALDNPIWVQSSVTVGTASATTPDGSTTAYVIIPTAGNGSFRELQQNTSVTAGTTYCISVYRREKEYRYAQIIGSSAAFGTFYVNFDLRTGNETAFSAGSSTVVGRGIIDCGNGWYRIWAAVTCLATTSSRMAIDIIANATDIRSTAFVANGTDGMYAFGDQFEVGSFPTSYIPTTTTSLTRNADNVTMTGTNFSSWYNASEGAFLAKFSFPVIPASQFRYVLSANDGTATNFIAIAGNTTSNVPAGRVIASSSTQASMGGGSIVANQQAIGVLAYKLDSFAYGQNGATIGTDATGLVPTVNRLDIGALTTSYACCHIQRVAYWPQRIINNEALAFSK